MRILTFAFVCLVANVALGGEQITAFAKHLLGLDLAKVSCTPTNGELKLTTAPISPSPLSTDTNLVWMTGETSNQYRQNFPNRILKYGFRDGRLSAIRISISLFADQGAEVYKRQKEELVQIQQKIQQVRAELTHEAFQPAVSDSNHSLQYGASCDDDPRNILLIEIHITPTEAKAGP